MDDVAQTQPRTTAEIEAEINAARERLAASVESLINQVHPKAIVHQGIADARAFAEHEFAQAKAQVIDDQGKLRTERVALAAAAVAGVAAFLLILRSVVRAVRRH